MPKSLRELPAIWAERAKKYGRRCVIDLSIPDSQFDGMTQLQMGVFGPLLMEQLAHAPLPNHALDFGCGPGRFCSMLHATSTATVIAYDPCAELIALAPSNYPQDILYATGSLDDFFSKMKLKFDLLWITLVLGGLQDSAVLDIAPKLYELINPNALIFFAEHTGVGGSDFWQFRSQAFYETLFYPAKTLKIGGYTTMGNEVSVFAGRKPAA